MDDLISRKALLEDIENADTDIIGDYDEYFDRKIGFSREWIKNIVNGFPSVDSASVVHGEWIELHEENGHEVGTCSHCRHVRIVDNFCPNCGAKMDGGNC